MYKPCQTWKLQGTELENGIKTKIYNRKGVNNDQGKYYLVYLYRPHLQFTSSESPYSSYIDAEWTCSMLQLVMAERHRQRPKTEGKCLNLNGRMLCLADLDGPKLQKTIQEIAAKEGDILELQLPKCPWFVAVDQVLLDPNPRTRKTRRSYDSARYVQKHPELAEHMRHSNQIQWHRIHNPDLASELEMRRDLLGSSLEQLKNYTTVIPDTGDFETIKKYNPSNATTSSSFILAAAKMPEYQHLIDEAINYGKKQGEILSDQIEAAADKLLVLFGVEILKIIPGVVFQEVDARFSFDKEESIAKAKKFIQLYEEAGISKNRIIIKWGSTWEGIEAAKVLEDECGIDCNLTLVASMPQAMACAEAGVTLISVPVGGIVEWYGANGEKKIFRPADNPGIKSVTQIYHYYKKFGYQTFVMGTNLRNAGEARALSGCDLLAISPPLFEELRSSQIKVSELLSEDSAKKLDLDKIELTEKKFRWMMNGEKAASATLSEGIQKLAENATMLEECLVFMFFLQLH